MKQRTGNEIRQLFLTYFEQQGHMVEPGASLIPHNDPTLLWINSGVAALKKYFDGSVKPKSNRICNAQKSIRTNDIENVGKTARHHTFFEMLGNFSIGDYFKEEAIAFAWTFLTDENWIGFPKDKMYITIHPDDSEAYRIWTTKMGVSPSRILKSEENYWQIGEGPSGPNTEIYYDRGEAYDPEGIGEPLFFEERENERYLEVWNVVFSQYDAKEGVDRKEFKELPQKNIDTGMGLERLVSIVQNVPTNFDTDLFTPMIRKTEALAAKPYSAETRMSYCVIADHVRTVTFALADGALFSNEGRGYVLRRILRRAVRYARKIGIQGVFMDQLVPVVVDTMKEFYGYLEEKTSYIQKLVKAEEERFIATLNEGEKLMMDVIAAQTSKLIDGAVAFKMYDTYGFPLELTVEMANEHGYDVDEAGFHLEMEQQRQRARDARDEGESMSSQAIDLMNFTAASTFLGYETLRAEGTVIGLFKQGVKVEELTDEGEVIFDQTPFYAESGGQVADHGVLSNEGTMALVSDVRKAPHKQHLHKVSVKQGSIRMGDRFALQVDEDLRNAIKANHSVTHLLQAALRQVVGTHIGQAGSYVCDAYMRFDFTHFEKVKDEQLAAIEQIVNREIAKHLDVQTQLMNIEAAKTSGAMALFDEKYEDEVRVVSMGSFSKELCGGTHVSNTAEIGVFKLQSEESIGSGIRRITGTTAYHAYEEFKGLETTLSEIASSLKMTSLDGVDKKVAALLQDFAALRKEHAQLQSQLITLKANEYLAQKEMIGTVPSIFLTLSNMNVEDMKSLASTLKEKAGSLVVVLTSIQDGAVTFVVGVTKDLNPKLHAGSLVKELAAMCDGRGGGRDDLAQAGGKDSSKAAAAIEQLKQKLAA